MSMFDITSLLNSESMKNKALPRKRIDYRQLIPHEKNHYSLEDIEELADSIENVGLLHDVLVKDSGETNENGDKLYKVVSGHRRVLAMTMLVEERKLEDFEEIPCAVIPENEEETITQMKLHYANMTSRDMTEYDKMIAISEMKKLIQNAKDNGIKIKGRVKEVVAEAVGLKPTQAQKYMTVAENSTEEVKEAIRDGQLTIEAAHNLIKENKAKTVEQQGKEPEPEQQQENVAVKPAEEKPKLDIDQVKNLKKETPRDKVFKKLEGFTKALDRNNAEFEKYEEIKALVRQIELIFEEEK